MHQTAHRTARLSARTAGMVAIATATSAGQVELFKVNGPEPFDQFGVAVRTHVDFDSDGRLDLVVGAPNADPGGVSSAGSVYVLSGATGTLLHRWDGTTAAQNLGVSLETPGDMNDDGVGDVLVGSRMEALLLAGGTGALIRKYGIRGGSAFKVGSMGDLDGDAVPEVLVGDWGFCTEFPACIQGRVDVLSGATGLRIYSRVGASAGDGFGFDLTGMDDMNGDGVADFVVGAPQPCQKGFCLPGYVLAISGATGEPLFKSSGQIGRMGGRVADAGDVNADGKSDLIAVELGCCSPGGPLPTRVVVYDGSNGAELFSMPGFVGFGTAPAGLGDVNGDGHDDFVLGRFMAGEKAEVYSGRDASLLFTVAPNYPGTGSFPAASATAGDWNDDGFPDFALAESSGFFVPGTVGVFSGAPTGLTTFGAGCASSFGRAPRIGYGSAPRIGTSLALHVSDTLPGLAAACVVGVPSLAAGLPLFGASGCALHVTPLLVTPAVTQALGTGEGVATFTLPIPADPTLVGKAIFAQWFVLNPPVAHVPAAATRGLAIVFQP